MWINSYKIERNILPPDWVITRIRINFTNLRSKVSSRVGNKFKVTMKFSMHSEACYLIITDKKTQRQIKISFRSHDNFAKRAYDKEILLYKYRTWKECEDYFINKVLKEVININGTKRNIGTF